MNYVTKIALATAFVMTAGTASAQLGDVGTSVGETVGSTTGSAFSRGVDAVTTEDQGGGSEFNVGDRGGPDCDGADANRPECDDSSPFGDNAPEQDQSANDDVFDPERDANR